MVIDTQSNRYINKCSCDQLRRRPLTLNIISILKESSKKQVTVNEVIKVGCAKYRNWPKDRNTILRTLKTMSKYHFVNEKKSCRGYATLWSLNINEISPKDLIIHEVKKLEQVISRLPQSMFEEDHIMVEINHAWQRIRTALIAMEKLDVAMNWITFDMKEKELLSSPSITPLDKQLSIIYIFWMLNYSKKLSKKWFKLSQTPIAVKADFQLMDIMKKHFYPKDTKDTLFRKLNKHEFDPDVSKILSFLSHLYINTLGLDYKYNYKIFEEMSIYSNKQKENDKILSIEENKIFYERMYRTSFILNMAKKRDYKIEEIDDFIESYKSKYNL